jgi:type IV pilus assembly protein PilE
MIAVAIIGILAMVAFPSYEAYFVRANRSATQSLMVTIANREVQYLLDARAYTATLGAAGLNVPVEGGWACTATCSSTRYTLSAALDAGPPMAFTVTATPTGRQSGDGVMTLTSAGVRSRIVGGIEKGW